MTEYTFSPEAIRVYMSSRERTERWVRSHSPFDTQFASPSVPPSVIVEDSDDDERDSDAESTHSLPPKMLLKYGDGRPDIPISHGHHGSSTDTRPRTTSHTSSRPSHRGSNHASYPRTHFSLDPSRSEFVSQHSAGLPSRHEHLSHPSQHPSRVLVDAPLSHGPEEIRIYPADAEGLTHPSSSGSRPSHRTRYTSEPVRHNPPLTTAEQIIETPSPRYVPTSLNVPQAPQVTYSQSQPTPPSQPPVQTNDRYTAHRAQRSLSSRQPPSIVYAPGRHSSENYAPPTMVYAPHHAPGMTYTVSAPTPKSVFPQYPRITPAPYPYVHSHLASVHEENRLADSRGPRGPRPRSTRPEDMRREPLRTPSPISEGGSGDSGSTYYVIPTPGQKIKVLVGPEASLYTATSTTKSPPSPYSGGSSGFKKPFFNRLFSFASDFSKTSSKAKRLQRSHSLDGPRRSVPHEHSSPR